MIDHGRVIAHDTPYGLKRIVGGQRLSIRPSDPANLTTLGQILAEMTGATPEPDGRDRLTVKVDSDEILPIAVNRLHQEGIRVEELSLHLPSLDEVFFSLTGRPAESESEDAA